MDTLITVRNLLGENYTVEEELIEHVIINKIYRKYKIWGFIPGIVAVGYWKDTNELFLYDHSSDLVDKITQENIFAKITHIYN